MRSRWRRLELLWKKHSFELWLLAPALLYLLGFLVIIVFHLLVLTFSYTLPLEDQFPSLQNFADLADSGFFTALWRTLLFVLVGTPLQLLTGLAAALLLQRAFRGRAVVSALAMLPLVIPSLVTAIILNIVFDYPFGHVNDLLTGRFPWFPELLSDPVNWKSTAPAALGVALLGNVWRNLPISMLILLSGLLSISEDYYEAAHTMGATGWQRFKFITLPLLTPAISTVLVLRSIELWKEFIFPFIVAPAYPTLGVLIERIHHGQRNAGLAALVSLLLVGCIAASTFVIQRSTRWLRQRLVGV